MVSGGNCDSLGKNTFLVENLLRERSRFTNHHQIAQNVQTIRSRMSSIMELIRPELSKLSALEFGKIAEYDFVYISIVYKYSNCKY